jgi:hypothetical protein
MSDVKAISDILLTDEGPHFQQLPEGHLAEHFGDHVGIGIFGRVGDKDILFVCTIYHIGGRAWGIRDGAVMQTSLLVSPNNGDRTMRDNDFVANRLDPIKSFDGFEITETDKSVTWKAGQRQIVCRPPYWDVQGTHMGVDVNLVIAGDGPSVPYHGTWDKLGETGVAGNEQLGTATGSITYQGTTYTLDEAWAVRERTCLGKDHNVPKLLSAKAGYIWGWVFSDMLKVFCFAQGGSGHFAGRVFIDNGIIDFGAEHTTVEAVDSWTDPRTHSQQATAWTVVMASEKGRLELDVRTWSRYLFGFHLVDAYTTHCGALGRTSGRFTFPDGRVVSVHDKIAYFEEGFSTVLPAA